MLFVYCCLNCSCLTAKAQQPFIQITYNLSYEKPKIGLDEFTPISFECYH